MSKINSEIIVSSLLTMGFDKVDSLLYTFVLGRITIDNVGLKMFDFEEQQPSDTFNKYIEYDKMIFKFKEGYNINSIVSLKPKQNIELPLYKVLNVNSLLIEYLKGIDFKEIIVKKIMTLGIDKINNYEELFSDKEKEIIVDMFGIGKMNKEKDQRQMQIYKNMMDQEERDNERMLAFLDSMIKSKNKEKEKIKIKEEL